MEKNEDYEIGYKGENREILNMHKCLRLSLILPILLNALKKNSAYYVCCIYSNAFQNTFTMAANTMNPDQTASKEFQFY